jgi:molecular chaperone DnaK (HSP70)
MLREAGRPLDERFIHCCKRVADELASRGKRIDRALLVGGNCRQPHVPEMVQTVFGLEPSRDADPDLVVAKGAAIWAAVCFGSKGQTVAIGEHRYLASEIEMKTVAAHAICVAAQRDKDDPEEYNCLIVPANAPLPHEFEERFAPAKPGSSEVVVKIVQGQKDEPSKNCPLLRKVTVPIQPSDNDENRITLKGRYTEEGLIEVTVVDDLLGRPISDSFVYKAGLSDAEIDQKRKQLRKDMGGQA